MKNKEKTSQKDSARVFFALLPQSHERAAIDSHTAQLSESSGKKVNSTNYHITLLFLGNVNTRKIESLCLDCQDITVPSFELTINQAGWWRKPKVLWLAPKKTPEELSDLIRKLKTITARRQLTVESRKYFPHITLMRKVDQNPEQPLVKPFIWQAHDFSLMESITRPEGVIYKELASWPLG